MKTRTPNLQVQNATLDSASWLSVRTLVRRGLPLALAVCLLTAFTSVVDNIKQRGEMRRLNQSATGSLVLPEELIVPRTEASRLASLSGEEFASR